jgi:hypothetical protein
MSDQHDFDSHNPIVNARLSCIHVNEIIQNLNKIVEVYFPLVLKNTVKRTPTEAEIIKLPK